MWPVILSAALSSSAMASDAGKAWWNTAWRYRTTAVRSTPWRDDVPRPVEVAFDFQRLLAEAGIEGEFDPASVRVISPRPDGPGAEVPFAHRSEYDPEAGRDRSYLAWIAHPRNNESGVYHVYFDTRDRGIAPPNYDAASVPPENLVANPGFEEKADELPVGWTTTSPDAVQLARFAHTTGRRSLKIVADENTPKDPHGVISVSQKIDVRDYAGREMVVECDLHAERAPYGASVFIELQQFRADGSRILEYAVEPRWLTIVLAEGQFVQFRERGRFSPEAAFVNLCARFRCIVNDADTGERIDGPESRFTVYMDRVVMRPGERWPWPAPTHAGYVEGALAEAPLNRAFEFTDRRRLVFNAASEGSLQSGIYNPDPRSVHWGLQAGTLEFWCRPLWGAEDEGERRFFEGYARGFERQSRLNRTREDGEDWLNFMIADSGGTSREISAPAPFRTGQWHHIAATWDFPNAHLQLFFDGKRVAEEGPGPAPWPSSLFATGGSRKSLGVGNGLDDTRSIPRQAFFGGDASSWGRRSAESALDEFRISDVPRYSGDFTPSRREFEVDDATRALFHFDNECNGVHGLDDQFVRGHLVCELPPRKETAPLEIWNPETGVESRSVLVAPYAPPEKREANRAATRLAPILGDRETPDPRFVEYVPRRAERIVRGEDDAFALDVGGDFDPLMQSITFEHAEDAGNETVRLPHWRANDNVVPFSIQTLAATLAPDARDDLDRALETFKFACATSYYFDAKYCETLPARHRSRTWPAFLKALNIYPSNQCGPLNYTLTRIFHAVGISAKGTGGTQHAFEEAFYNGGWRLFDLSAPTYWLKRDDAAVAGQRDLFDDPYLLIRNQGGIGNFIRGEPSLPSFETVERPHNMDFFLRPGEKASFCWHNEGRWFELMREREPLPIGQVPPYFGNGAIVYSPVAGGDAAVFENLTPEAADGGTALRPTNPEKPASMIYRLQCPYTISDASVTGTCEAPTAGAASLSLSFDRGETWTPVWTNKEKSGELTANMLDHVTARYEYWLKLDLKDGACVTGLRVRTTFVQSPFVLPGKLSLGSNRIAFVNMPPAESVRTVCRWLERRKTDLGVFLNAFDYPMLSDEPRRNLLLVAPDRAAFLALTTTGRPFEGEVALERLPPGWSAERLEAETGVANFRVQPSNAIPGEIETLDLVLREGDRERRDTVHFLVADSPLAREAEAADEISGDVAVVEHANASGGRLVRFTGDGELRFAFSAPQDGTYALWLRAEWANRWRARLSLILDDAEPRSLRTTGLRGFQGWTDANVAYSKPLHNFGARGAFWYRISDIRLTPGEHVLTLRAPAKTDFDALVLLPQTPEMDRAGTNLFHNWNYAPQLNPF